ncbi:MAG: flippase-like domain-containing protein, partial [Acidobacteriota bacterium]|nr:flippase-like domain-containing protein [Acidobacteriota bacterium]
MATARQRNAWWWGALGAGAVLFAITIYFTDFSFLETSGRQASVAVLYAIAASGLWHVARTWAWARSFPDPRPVSFGRLARVRIAAEAFSYLTIRGIAGEPLKVMMLRGEVDARDATAAVALERIAFMCGTTLIVGAGSLTALATQDLSAIWFNTFLAFAIVAGVVAMFVTFVLIGRRSYLAGGIARVDRVFGTRMSGGRIARFASAVEDQLLDLVRGNPGRLFTLAAATVAAYLVMCAEVWLVLRAMGTPVSFASAMSIETFSRVVSFATVFIPANLGGLEASSVAAVAAVGAAGAGGPLAFARRARGIFWAGLGLAVYPRPRVMEEDAPGATLLVVPSDPAVTISPFSRVAGLPIAERAMRSAFRAGYGRVMVLADEASESRLRRIARDIRGDVRIVRPAEWAAEIATLGADETVSAIGAGTVVSHVLLKNAAARGTFPGVVADVPAGEGWPVSGLVRLRASDAADAALLSRELHARLIA